MKLSLVLTAHQDTEIVNDTLDSIYKYVTDDAITLIDGGKWDSWGQDAKINSSKIKGFIHNHFRSPHRNVFLAIRELRKTFPDSDWYIYCEYDVLFCNSDFKIDLANLAKENYWVAGNDVRFCPIKDLPFVDLILKDKAELNTQFLGCCYFLHKDYIETLEKIDFFNRFIYYTNQFPKEFFPKFSTSSEYDLAEILVPSLAEHFGGKVYNLANWETIPGVWRRNFIRYPMRFTPELKIQEVNDDASIIHPLKTYHNEIRYLKRCRRNLE